MKLNIRNLAAYALTAALIFSPIQLDAASQSRRGNGGAHRNSTTTTNRNSRPGNSNRQGNSNGNRPGGNRPGHNNNGNRPGNNNSANRPGGNRPGHGNNGYRPGGNCPGGNYRPPVSAPRPGAGAWNRPAHRPWARPLPPPPPRPARIYAVNPIAPVLGMVYGTLINAAVNQLVGAGYNIASYTNDAIILSNVSQLGFNWPAATLYYAANGFNRSRFQYFTNYLDLARYNALYASLSSLYGYPVNVVTGPTYSATWWGGGQTGYVTISCAPGTNQYGQYGYFTDLIYGF